MKQFLVALALMLVATVSAAQNYRLQPGDSLSIEVLEDPSLNRQTFILPDGRINFPLAGSIAAAGRTVSQVQANLTAALAPNFASEPTVFVAVSRLAPEEPQVPLEQQGPPTIDVYVTGEVNSPGKLQIEEGTQLLQFLAESGGFTRFAATKRLQLRRTDLDGQVRTYTINYRAIENGARIVNNFTMRDGDVLVVPQRGLFE